MMNPSATEGRSYESQRASGEAAARSAGTSPPPGTDSPAADAPRPQRHNAGGEAPRPHDTGDSAAADGDGTRPQVRPEVRGGAAGGDTAGHGGADVGSQPAGRGGLLFNVVIPLLLLAAGTGIVVALGSVEPKARQAEDRSPVGRLRRLPPAEVMQVRSLSDVGKPLELRVDGVVVPYREVKLAAEISGRIIEKAEIFNTGNYVRKGQLLCRIDPTDYEQEILRLSRAREQDYEALKEIDQEVANTKSMLDIAKQEVELAQRELARMQSLPRGFVSESEVEQAQRALLAATQSQVTMENQMSLLAARRGRLEASERLATTQLETAQINLARSEVRSPADGVIVREDADVNSFVQRGDPIVTLEDVSKAEVAVNLRMDQLYWVLDQDPEARFAPGAGSPGANGSGQAGYSLPPTPAVIEYEVAGMGGRTYRWDGTLVRYDGIGMDSRSRTVPVTIQVDAPRRFGEQGSGSTAAGPTALVRGMYVKVRLLIKPKTPLVAIPSLAIRPGNRVWRFEPDPAMLSDTPGSEPATPPSTDVEQQTAQQDAVAGQVGQSEEASPSAAADRIDPDQWVPGRVTAQGDITPVDSLWLSSAESAAAPIGSEIDQEQQRYWICDVPGDRLSGGDWVVISPLGDLGNELGDSPLPVRVPLSEMQP